MSEETGQEPTPDLEDETEGTEEPEPPRGLRRWLPNIARLVVFALLLIWFFFYADRQAFAAAFATIPLLAFVPATLLGACVITIGGIRWRVLMGAFGAKGTKETNDLPSIVTTVRLFFVGLFYNTFVPGSIGGDVVRGVVTRHYFKKSAASYMVIVLERLIGFSAMGLVFLLGIVIGPDIIDVREHLPALAILLGIGLMVVILALVSGRVATYWRRIPPIERPINLFWVFCLSFVAHFSGIGSMYVLAAGMGLPISYADLVLIMPVAFTAAVIPLNVLGIGTREVTLVALLPLLGIEQEQALALSLGYAIKSLGLATIGGLIQVIQGRVGVKKDG